MKPRSYLSSKCSGILDVYGTLIVPIYASYMFILSFLVFLRLFIIVSDILTILLISLFLIFGTVHNIINRNLAREERFPYQLLYHQRISTRIFFIVAIWFISTFTIALLCYPYFEELAEPLTLILGMSFILSVSILLPSVILVLYTFHSHKEARLCFKVILEILQGLPIIERERFVNKNLRLVKLSFNSCSSFLADKPFNLELKEKEQYCNVVYTAMLIGNPQEIERTSTNIKNVLVALGSKRDNVKLREFLVALRHIAGKFQTSTERELSLTELSDMLQASSSFDRFKARIRSPFTVSIVAIVTLAITVLAVLLQTLRG